MESPDIEFTEKLDKLSSSQIDTMRSIEDWLTVNRDYRDYDLSDKFRAEKLIPLIKYVDHGELVFEDNRIIQKLRKPLELTNKGGEVTKTITELSYKSRYQDYEFQSYTKGIDISKEPIKYVNAHIAMLTNQSSGIIGKLYDTDSGLTKLVSGLYFLE